MHCWLVFDIISVWYKSVVFNVSIGVELGPAVGTIISSLSRLSVVSGGIEGVVYVLSVGFAFGEMVGW